jgi:gamma-glutamyl:cysteine ligase YbdK (ATP-grasp superfamily)
MVRPEAQKLGALPYLAPIEDILSNGTGAHRQIQHMITNGGDFNAMIHSMRKEFYL